MEVHDRTGARDAVQSRYYMLLIKKCIVWQLQTIPYEKDWHEMDRATRLLAVRRVHDVIFSQVIKQVLLVK